MAQSRTKTQLQDIILGIALIIIVICLIWTSFIGDVSTRESLLLSIILSVASGAFSWVISSYYSKQALQEENTKLIDRIGEQSSEKILNQSKQLYSVEQYLEAKQAEVFDKNADNVSALYLESTRNMIRLIRSSNNTYLSDWAGVVSDGIRSKITEQSNAQSQLFEDIDLISSSTPANREILEQKIEHNAKKLPSHLVPKPNPKQNYASVISHEVTEDTEQKKSGVLEILFSEDSFKGHVVGKFHNHFSSPPKKSQCQLLSKPQDNEIENINVFAKTGTVHDFHIGIKSFEFNAPLKKGIYKVSYEFELV